MENPLYLEGNYEVAVKELFLPPISHPTTEFKDAVYLPGEKLTYKTLQEFVDKLLNNSWNRQIYSKSYFAKYLDPNIEFTSEVLDASFAADTMSADNRIEAIADVQIDIDKLFEKDELDQMETPSHHIQQKKKPVSESIFTFRIPMFDNVSATMLQVLNYMIRRILFQLRGSEADRIYHLDFTLRKEHYENDKNIERAMSKHRKLMKKIIHRFILRFVGCVTTNLKNSSENALSPINMIFIYSDFIEPTYVSGFKSRLLHIEFLKEKNARVVHSSYPNPVFFKVEKRVISSLSFSLFDEFGDKIVFVPSYSSTHMTLAFRRILGGQD